MLGQLVKRALHDRRFWITPIVRMRSPSRRGAAPSASHWRWELDGLRILRNDRSVTDAAMRAVGELAERGDGYHRVPLTDALTAAAAAEHGGLAVLHRDAHFDRLAEVLAVQSIHLPGP